ncbi:unnamed protein product, partial [Effrenium voratum]
PMFGHSSLSARTLFSAVPDMPCQRKLGRTRPLFAPLIGVIFVSCYCASPEVGQSFMGIFGEPEEPGKKGPSTLEEAQKAEEQQEYDWKEAAYERQMERIAARKRKAQPNYKETAQERKVRLRKLAMWNAAQRKGMTSVVGREAATVDIKVKLAKPMGIEFEKRDEDPNRAWVSGIFKEGSAYENGEVEAGDFLAQVNGVEAQRSRTGSLMASHMKKLFRISLTPREKWTWSSSGYLSRVELKPLPF